MKKDFKKVKRNGGAAMLISVVFFLFISLAIISGLVSPTVREFRSANVNLNSKKSYFLAESGSEDALYRVLKNMAISGSETLTLNNNSATTTITSVSGSSKQITSLGDVSSYQRKTDIVLSVSATGTSFNYGVQVGSGGVEMGQNSNIIGNIYSNGSISGENGAKISGDTIVAGHIEESLVARSTSCLQDVVVGKVNPQIDFAQSFVAPSSDSLAKVSLYLKKVGDPSSRTVKITADNNGLPDNQSLVSGTLNSDLVTTSYRYSFYRTITIDRTKVPNTNQTNFPVLISGTYAGASGAADLRTTGNGGKVQNTSGYDIVFASDAGCSSFYKFERVNWGASTGTVEFWVKIPTVTTATDTVFYMCYGNSSISTDQQDAANTWDSNFKGVWHLQENPTGAVPQMKDSTSNANHGTSEGSQVSSDQQSAKINGGLNYDGSNDDTNIPDTTSLRPASALTVGAWVYRTGNNSSSGVLDTIVDKRNSATATLDSYMLAIWENNKYIRFCTEPGSNPVCLGDSSNTATVTDNTWTYVVGTWDGSNLRVYKDGSQVGSTLAQATAPVYTANAVYLGAQDQDGIVQWRFKGLIDEARISGTARSADWIKAEYNNQNSPSTFYTVGSETAVGTGYGWIDITFSSPPLLTAGNTYWVILDADQDNSKYWVWCDDSNNGYSGGVGKYSKDWDHDPWTQITGDLNFRTYFGAGASSLDGVTVLEDAKANTITNSKICGDAYYKSIDASSLNFLNNPTTQVCGTPTTIGTAHPNSPDPPVENMPISQGNINQWKTDAEAGGTISGDYSVTSNVSLGPKEITGDLLMTSNNKTLTITGTIYVHGNIDIDNGSTIHCDASYGTDSCLVVTNGWIHASNNGTFAGSGTAGSFIMLLTTLACDGSFSSGCTHHNGAVDVHNNATGVIFYAQSGKINLHNGVNITEVTAYKLVLDNTATVTYNQGLANANFTSGPSGGYSIDSWKETK